MNATFYAALDRLPLATVAAIEFLPVVVLAVLGVRTFRNASALALAVGGVSLLTDARIAGEPLGFVLAFANAALFACYIVLAHRMARHGAATGIDGLAVAMVVAAIVITPIGGWAVVPVMGDAVALAAGIGVGIASSVVPYVSDQLAMARVTRSTYALLVSLQPATATLVGILILGQVPSPVEVVGVVLVVAAVGIHRERETAPA
jgi:inner membrane transporter RhtA